MRWGARRAVAVIGVVGLLLSAPGCAVMRAIDGESVEEESDVLTWQQAKAEAQSLEREIASRLLAEVVVNVDQSPTGTLMSCVRGGDSWHGVTTVTVVEGTDVEALVRGIEAYFSETSYLTGHRRDIRGYYVAKVGDVKVGSYVRVSEGFEPNEIRIASASACFTLPEGTWPGDTF